MTSLDFNWTIQKFLQNHSGASGVLQRHGIDRRFAANLTLTETCAMHGLDPRELLQELDENQWDARFLPQSLLEEYGLQELIGYILATHHAYVREELPRLEKLMGEALRLDGAAYPQLTEIFDWFADFKASLDWHMKEEEKNLFPLLLGWAAETAWKGSPEELEGLLGAFEAEEAGIQTDLDMLRKKTGEYEAPAEASQATRELFHELNRMETEIRRHIHDESHILHPKVTALAQERQKGKAATGRKSAP